MFFLDELLRSSGCSWQCGRFAIKAGGHTVRKGPAGAFALFFGLLAYLIIISGTHETSQKRPHLTRTLSW